MKDAKSYLNIVILGKLHYKYYQFQSWAPFDKGK